MMIKKEDKEFQILLIVMIALLVIGFMDYYPMLSYIYLFYAIVYSEKNFREKKYI